MMMRIGKLEVAVGDKEARWSLLRHWMWLLLVCMQHKCVLSTPLLYRSGAEWSVDEFNSGILEEEKRWTWDGVAVRWFIRLVR